tara:strand:+ start:345 stop:737 length:393 start_codon:yes stop_codon:yes gene_type:complete
MPSDKYIKDLHDSARMYNIDSSAKDYLDDEWGLVEVIASEHQTEAEVQRAIDKAYRDYPKRPLPSWMDDKELEYFGYDKELVECDHCDGRGWHTKTDFGFNAPTFVRACEKCGGYAVLRAKDGIGSGWNF